VLGIALFWSGRSGEAIPELAESVDTARAAGNHLAVIHASGGLAAIHAERGELEAAEGFASAALELAEETSLVEHWATTMARVVRARALERAGRLAEAGEEFDRGVKLSRRGVAAVEIGYALLSQAEARQLRGDTEGARAALRGARPVVQACAQPGILEDMLHRTERRLSGAPRRPLDGQPLDLTERELAVLRLLPGGLSQREIADALYVSLNTIKSHTKSIYRKLSVNTRDAAVSRGRELGLV
jgi:LuxR family maltose regulon positive regulatory protein